jgi:hypothetical protein
MDFFTEHWHSDISDRPYEGSKVLVAYRLLGTKHTCYDICNYHNGAFYSLTISDFYSEEAIKLVPDFWIGIEDPYEPYEVAK